MAPTTSGAAFRWSRWMPHPSARLQWPQVDHGSIPRLNRGGSLAWVAQGGCYIKNQVRDPIVQPAVGLCAAEAVEA